MTQKSVRICAKCGRGVIGKESMGAPKDGLPVWWTADATGPMCNGRLVWVSREVQIAFIKNIEDRIDP